MSFGFRGKSHLVDNCFQKENNFKIQHILHLTRDIDLGRGVYMGEKSSSLVAHLEAHNSNTDLQDEPKPVESGNTFKSIQEELDSLTL